MPSIADKRTIKVPDVLVEAFRTEHRISVHPSPGLWPVDARLLKSGMLDKLINDEEFMSHFDIMIMPSQR